MIPSRIAPLLTSGAVGAVVPATMRFASSRATSAVSPLAISLSRAVNRADGVSPVRQLNTFRLRNAADRDAELHDDHHPAVVTLAARASMPPGAQKQTMTRTENRRTAAPFQFADPSLLQSPFGSSSAS